MAVAFFNWDTSWATTSINASSITTGNSVTTTAAISNDGKVATEVSVEIAYGAVATAGVTVELLRDVDGTNFEATADVPWGLEMPRSVSTTYRRTFTVYAEGVSSFKIRVANTSGATVTATVRTRQATFDSA